MTHLEQVAHWANHPVSSLNDAERVALTEAIALLREPPKTCATCKHYTAKFRRGFCHYFGMTRVEPTRFCAWHELMPSEETP